MDNMIKISELQKAYPLDENDVFVVNQENPKNKVLETRYTTTSDISKFIEAAVSKMLLKQIPVGCVKMYAGDITQFDKLEGWLVCNGQAVSRVRYSELYKVIGGIYGPSTGETFTLPDFRGKIPLGYCGTNKQPILLGDTGIEVLLADTGGEYRHRLTESELASHTHTARDDGHSHIFGSDDLWPSQRAFIQKGITPVPGQNVGYDAKSYSKSQSSTNLWNTTKSTANISLSNSGGNMPHNNIQPYLAVNYIIKY